MKIVPNKQQKKAVIESVKWLKSGYKQVFEISGPPGSGKTFIVYLIRKAMKLNPLDVLFMAYVGKATMALTLQGNNAKTMHSSIYDRVDLPKMDENGKFILKNGRILTTPGFVKKKSLPDNIKLIVVDEGSMINEKYALDILSFKLPVLVLGDLNQLFPIFGKPYFLRQPDIILTEIMRQAKDDPIIHLSQKAINGEIIEIGKYGDRCFVINKEDITDNMLTKTDIVICGKNKTRDHINKYVREEIYKIDKPYPVKGEKLICRQNNWDMSVDEGKIFLVNGLVGYVEETHLDTYNKRSLCIDFRPEFLKETCFERVAIDSFMSHVA